MTNYLEIQNTLLDYYSNLLIVQYNGKPKATAFIKLLTKMILANMIIMQIRDAFDWKTAVGKQLDVIGAWVGVSRNYNAVDSWNNTYLSYPSYGTFTVAENDPQRGGYSDYLSFDTLDGGVLTYKDLQSDSQKLDDDDFRVVIGLKIIKNSINHTCGEIDKAIFDYFNQTVYTTWETPYVVTYHYPISLSTIINICLYKGVLLAPTGCSIQLAAY